MKNLKKVLSVVLLLIMVLMTACSSQSTASNGTQNEMYTIGIGQFAEHPSLDNCRKGFIEGLKDEGFVEGQNISYKYENAQTDGSIANQIYTNYVNNKVDLLMAIATPMAQSAYGLARDTEIPVVYTAITDPVAAELANENGTPVGNCTGTSDKLPVDQQLALIKELYPNCKNLGILYTTSEVNSTSSINEYKFYATKYDIDIITVAINESSDMPMACDNILGKVDAMTNVTDNTVVASLPILISKAKEKNIPVFGSEIEQVKLGCVACMGLDYVELGKQTGRMAAKILRGEKKAKDINFETIENASLYLNEKVMNDLGLELNDELKNRAAEIY